MNFIFPVDLKQGISGLVVFCVCVSFLFFFFTCVWMFSQKNTENETFIFLPSEKVSSFLGRSARVALELLSSILAL